MAVTSLWKIKGRIDNAINYIEDPDKTDGSRYSNADLQSLQDVMDYATDPDKTELRMYVTGINVTPDNARYMMMQTKERIIMNRNGIRRLSKPEEPKHYKVKGSLSNAKRVKLTGFKALYFHYLYLFKKIRRKQAPPKVTYYMREELIKLDRYKAQLMFLHKNQIETTEQLQHKRAEATAHIAALTNQRQKLYGKKGDDRGRTPEINAELKELHKTVRMCNNIEQDATRIAERSQKIKQIQAELEKLNKHKREYEK